jgi:hypothetical protein
MAEESPNWFSADATQAQVYDAFCQEMKDSWVWLFRSRGRIEGHSVGQYSAILTPERAKAAVRDASWDVHIGSGGHGFTEYFEDEGRRTVYERYPGDGAELLVSYREFHGVRPSDFEVVEEFRLLFNLWEDRPSRTLYCFDGSGYPIKAVTVDERGVRALASLVRRYQAAKQAYLALYLDSTLRSEELDSEEHRWEEADENKVFSYYRGTLDLAGDAFSRLLGKRLLPPPPIETCGIPPFEKEEGYEDFLIGLSEMGAEIRHTSDPDQLANYFGANPDSPHYLTPVYFRREVLSKYYADPDRFSIEDGYLRCTGLWGLRLDNDQAGHIMVFLGDLGRDIPREEAQYWRSFNIPPPEEGPSETLMRRAFGGQFAEPKSTDLRFPRAYLKTSEAWNETFGWPLFRPLHDDDKHVLGKLHSPVTESAAEFDEQVLYLAKLLVDSINEESIKTAIGKGDAGERALSKLERFLTHEGMEDARALLKPFADVQGLRSRGAAHRKGSSFDISSVFGDLDRRAGFEKLLGEAVEVLDVLLTFAQQKQ